MFFGFGFVVLVGELEIGKQLFVRRYLDFEYRDYVENFNSPSSSVGRAQGS